MSYTTRGVIRCVDAFLIDGQDNGTKTFQCLYHVEGENKGIYGVVVREVLHFYGNDVDVEQIYYIRSTDGQAVGYELSYKNTNPVVDEHITGTLSGSSLAGIGRLAIYRDSFSVQGIDAPTFRKQYNIWECSIPLFYEDDTESINEYVQTGDDSGAINYDELHISKYAFHLFNDGHVMKVSWSVSETNDGAMSYYTVQLVGANGVNETRQAYNTLQVAWDSLRGSVGTVPTPVPCYECDVIIRGYSEQEHQLFELKGHCTRQILGIFSQTTATVVIGEHRGNTLSASTSDQYEEEDSDPVPDVDPILPPDDPSVYNYASLLTVYKVTAQSLSDLGDFLWQKDFMDAILQLNDSPLENIVSCKQVPCNLTGYDDQIQLGNVSTGVGAVRTTSSTSYRLIGSYYVPRYSVGFLNYDGFTTVSLYLPLHGVVELSASDTVGSTIYVYFMCDVITGSFGYNVYTDKGGSRVLIYSCEGNCAIDIPLTASNRAQVESAKISAVASGVQALASDNPFGVASSIFDIATTQNHTSRFGSPSSSLGKMNPSRCYVLIRYPIVVTPETFPHTHGYLCMSTHKLANLSGFTKLSNNVDLSGFDCTQPELDELKAILTSGFYL